MKTKKFLACILTVMMCAAVLPSGMVTTVSAKTGDADDPYQISTEAELIAFANAVNGGETGACAILTKDIVCTGDTWTPIGTNEQRFNGVFDGNGNKITGLSTAGINPVPEFSALFGYIGENGTVKNLAVKHGSLIGRYKSGIAYNNYGTIEGCANAGAITITEKISSVGGIAVFNYGTIRKCINVGALTGEGQASRISGIVRYNPGTIEECINTGALTGKEQNSIIGGIANENGGTIKDCINTGVLDAPPFGIGGIAETNNKTIENCISVGTILQAAYSGGIADVAGSNSTTKNCRYMGDKLLFNAVYSGATTENVKKIWAQEMEKQESFPFLDFEKTWVMTQDYPTLKVYEDLMMLTAYKIDSEEALMAFATAVNGGETNACAILTKDIVCTGNKWEPIGTDEQRFNGIFNGNGYKITGLSDAGITPAPTSSTIFNDIGFDGTVKNLTVEHGNLIGSSKSGIAIINYGTIKKCINTGAMSVTGEDAGVCGIAHLNNGTIEECMNTGALSASGKCSEASGIVGSNSKTVKRCINTGALTATGELSSASGITKVIYSEIEECANTGAISASGVRSAASGIAYSNTLGWVTDCINTGEAKATNNAAGIICSNDGWVENCINIGATSANFAGSIIQDRLDTESNLKNCRSSIPLNYDESGENVSQISEADFAKQESFPFLDFEKIWVMGKKYPMLRVYEDLKMQAAYKIDSEEALIAFANAVNGGETGACAILTKDIVCTGNTWTPIGTKANKYVGVFDGKGYKIAGLSDAGINPAPEFSALFGYIGEDGTVKNLEVMHGSFISKYKSGIACYNYGTIEGCTNTGAITATGELNFISGMSYENYGTIENCINTGTITVTGDHSDIVGMSFANKGTIKGCANTGAMTATGTENYINGMSSANYGTIENCINTGVLTASGTYCQAGGMTDTNCGVIEACLNVGAINAEKAIAGGIAVVSIVGSTVKNCRCLGNISPFEQSNYATVENVSQISEADFAKQSSFPFLDFDKTWVMGEEYPIPKLVSHKVTFYANNGSSASATQAVVAFTPTALKKNGFSYSEHEFEGWSTAAKGDKVYDDKETVTLSADLELYAKWNSNVAVAPTIKEQPKALKVIYGYTNASFSVTAEAAEGHTLSYQWYTCENTERKNPKKIDGATSATYTIPEGKDSGDEKFCYFCAVRATKGEKYAETQTNVVTLEIKQKTLTITPDDKQKEYGDPDPELTAKVEGLVGDDTIEYTLSRIEGEEIMDSEDKIIEYPINVNIQDKYYPNYIIVRNTGKLTISKKTVTAKAVDKQKVYGDPDPEMEYVLDGVSESEKKEFGITVSRDKAGDVNGKYVGLYAICVEAKKTETDYYKLECVNGVFEITPKPVTVTAVDKEKPYGDPDPELTVEVEGLVGKDEINDCTLSRAAGEELGEYEISVSVKAASNPNYIVTTQNGKLTVKRRPVTVKAEDKQKIFGEVDPILTATVSGTLGTDSVSYTLSRTANENFGEYVITPAGDAEQGNYALTFETGKFNILRRPVTVKAADKEKTYGDADPLLTATVSGTLGTDSVSYTLSREEKENVGECTITPAGDAEQGNYAVTFETGKFNINKRPATVTVKNAQKIQGDSDPEFSATVEGVVAGDALDYNLSREEGENEGRYAINAVLGNNPNYEITTVSGELSIEVVRASSRSSERKIEKKTTENGEITLSDKDAKPGDTVTISATPKEGYELEKFVVTDANRNSIEVTMNEDGTGSFRMPDSSVSISAVFVPKTAPSVKFADVPEDSWYYEYVEYMVNAGLMVGTDEDTFEPDGKVSRAMMVTILYRMEGTPEVSPEKLFDDVDSDSWYAAAVAWAAKNKIISGIDEKTFGQDLPITREQFATILYRYAGYKGYDTSKKADISGYDDVTYISGWALDAMRWANAEKFVTGRTETTLDPLGNTTRAEAAAIFTRFSKWIAENSEE